MENYFRKNFSKKIANLIDNIIEKIYYLTKFLINDFNNLEKRLVLIDDYVNSQIINLNSSITSTLKISSEPKKTKFTKKFPSLNKPKKDDNDIKSNLYLNVKDIHSSINKYLVNKLKRKIKEQKEINKLRELEYLEKLIILESKVKKFGEKNNLNTKNKEGNKKNIQTDSFSSKENNIELSLSNNYKKEGIKIIEEKIKRGNKFYLRTDIDPTYSIMDKTEKMNSNYYLYKNKTFYNQNSGETNKDKSFFSKSNDPSLTSFSNTINNWAISRSFKSFDKIKKISNESIPSYNLKLYKEFKEKNKVNKKYNYRHDFQEIMKSIENGKKKIIQFKDYFNVGKAKQETSIRIHHKSINFN